MIKVSLHLLVKDSGFDMYHQKRIIKDVQLIFQILEISDEQLNLDIINYFLYSLIRVSDDSQLLFNFIEFNKVQKTINYIIYFYVDQSIIKKTLPIDIFNFEGVWIFFYFYNHYDINHIFLYYYQSNLDQLYQETLDSMIKVKNTDQLKSSIRYFKNIQIQETNIITYPFLGIIKQVETTSINILEDLTSFKQTCNVELLCMQIKTQLLSYNESFTGGQSTNGQTDNIFQNTYKFSGWVKQTPIDIEIKFDSALLAISINWINSQNQLQQYELLQIMYNQHQIISLNGFQASTYSYSFPYLESFDQIETFQILDDSLQDLLTQWHFIQYEEGSSLNQGRPIYRVYFPQNDQFIECKWNHQINHFSDVILNFQIGGDYLSSFNFRGQLSDWKFSYYCQRNYESSYEIPCHYSCQTCKGITDKDCLSCDENLNRIYSPNTNQCICLDGYLETSTTVACKSLSDYNGVFELKYLEVPCNTVGYYQCDESKIQCDFGYFQYYGSCIACPHFSQDIMDYKLNCALCYLSPGLFNQTFLCDFDLIAENSESPFYFLERFYSDVEIYKLNFNNRFEFSSQIIGGKYMQQNQTYCKSGYFLQQGECHLCIDGCEYCESEYFCVQCSPKYYLTTERICKLCTKCDLCYFDSSRGELCQYDFYCLEQQYYQNNLCIDCGQYCKQCDSLQCFYCIQDKKYYISLDRINCAYCSIENCEYCYEYVYDNENNLIVSIDINREQIMNNFYQIHLGCAQCAKGYYYSFQTQKCQLLSEDMAECDVGYSLDVNQGIVCLKSQSLSNSIQSTFCQDTQLCSQCINNYSPTLPSFCIVCKEGYYSNVQTGLCKQCPNLCQTCSQQSSRYKDYWKWEIKAFYFNFINQNGQHPFETYSNDLDNSEQEIICLSCQPNYLLFQNACIPGCDADCEDCRIISDALQQYSSRCLKCKSTVFNKLRSYKYDNLLTQIDSQCESCPNYCTACYPRTSSEISQINLFFNQTSQYLKYSFKCYYVDENQKYKYIVPETLSLQNCGDLKKCTKSLETNFKVYSNLVELINARSEETNINLLEIYQYLLDMSLYYIWGQYETPELLEQYNNQNIEEFQINYQLESSENYLDFGSTLKNNLKQNVFNLKRVIIKMYALNKSVLYSTFRFFKVINFDQIIFENFDFKSPTPYFATPKDNITLRFEITNVHYPQIVIFKNVNIVQTSQNNTLDFTLKCNRSKYFSITDMNFNLNLTGSIFFQYYPFISTEVSKVIVKNFRVFNNFLYNSSLFYFFAENNTFNSVISFINVTIQNTLFTRNSSFITSNFQKDYDIGIIQLENFTLIDVIFENSSSFIRILSGKQISVTNFKLKNIKFLDQSSFLIANTFSIVGFDVEACYLELGNIITNYGKFSESNEVRESSEVLFLENINFTNNKYLKEKAFIYVIQNQVSNISIIVNNLYLFNNQYFNVEVGKLSYSFVSGDLSQLYFECSYCTFENLNITRGLGYPELTIKNSKLVKLKKFTLQQSPQFELKSLHTSINCIRQFYFFDLPFVLNFKQFLKVYIDDVNISDSVIIDYPYFIFEGQNLNDQAEPDFITITNSIFANNMLIITQLNRLSSIISVQTYQDTKIFIQNSTFQGNFLNKYEDDTQLHSSSTIIIDSQIGQVIIQDCLFQQNTVSNSSDSNIYIKSETLVVQNCIFFNQNQLSHQLLQKHLLIPIDQTNYNDIVNEIFWIMSQGGSGYFFINELTMIQCVVNASLAVNGGAFYINTKSTGRIIIANSSFENTLTMLNSNQFSSGGVLYIQCQH